MTLKKNLLKLVLGGMLVSSLTACNNAGSSMGESYIYSFDIDGNKIYYSLDNPEAKSIQELVEGFLQTSVAVDYKNFDALAVQEYYVQAIKEKNIANNLPAINLEQVNSNQLKIEVDEIEFSDIKISSVGTVHKADISGVFKVTYKSGAPEHLIETETELNTVYKRRMEVKVEKEGDNWKISQASIYPKEKV